MLFDNVQVPHYNYVGDSILGYKSHMGAGSITSNVKSDKTKVTIRYNDDVIATGLKKMGAILGNFVEVGCNSVLNRAPSSEATPMFIRYPWSEDIFRKEVSTSVRARLSKSPFNHTDYSSHFHPEMPFHINENSPIKIFGEFFCQKV